MAISVWGTAYEKDLTQPKAGYLAAIAKVGANIQYIVTGEREGPPPLRLTSDEEVLLEGFRALDAANRRRMLGFVLGGEAPEAAHKQINVSATGGQAAGGDIVNKGERFVFSGRGKK